eukprot:jgi/Chrzof1/14484/Cz09g04150.t1
MSDGDTKLLSFGDVLLRKSDVELLRTPNWLNDQIIAFHFEYLSREKYADMQQVVSFMSGATTFLLLNAGSVEETRMIFQPLQLSNKQLVFFAINDNPDVEQAAGGSHW